MAQIRGQNDPIDRSPQIRFVGNLFAEFGHRILYYSEQIRKVIAGQG